MSMQPSPTASRLQVAQVRLPHAFGDGEAAKVSVHVARGLAHFAECVGIGRRELLRAADIEPEQLESIEGRLLRSDTYRLVEAALDLIGDPALALHYSDRLGTGSFGALATLSVHAPTMRDALTTLMQFLPMVSDQRAVELVEHGDTASLRFVRGGDEPLRVLRFGAELANVGFYRFLRSYGARAKPRQVCFQYAAPAYRAEYARFFGGLERFDQPFTGIVFDRELLSLPSANRDEGVHEALKELAARRISRMSQSTPYAQQVRELLVTKGWPHRTDMSTVARWLGISVRSLRRRLVAEGKPYGEILNQALGIVAKQLLRERERTIQQVGYEMGFSNTSAFHRAFKRWTGTTPSAYRDALLAQR